MRAALEQLTQALRNMLPTMNTNDRADMFNAAKPGMPPQAFQGFLKLAEQVLKPDGWLALKTRFGI